MKKHLEYPDNSKKLVTQPMKNTDDQSGKPKESSPNPLNTS